MTDQPPSSGRVLVVDDSAANVDVLCRLLTRQGYTVASAGDGAQALDMIEQFAPDLVLLDVMMPGMPGFEVCQRLKSTPATRLIPVVVVTGLHEGDARLAGINAGADDFLTKPVNPQELMARVRSLVRLKRYTDELESAESVILSLAMTIEARDPYTEGHCHRLAGYASALGRHLGLPEEDVLALRQGGILHDVGKVGIPDVILLSEGPLSADEFELMKRHTTIGDRLCQGMKSLRRVRPIVRHHHERLDGSGYPDRLRASDVPLIAQIVGVVDVYDALTTNRPYRQAVTPREAIDELRGEVRKGWRDGDLVEMFVALLGRGDFPDATLPGLTL